MSMLDLQKIYEESAFALASELQAYVGLYMKPIKYAKSKTGKQVVPRNPDKGVGTLRLITGNLYRSFTPRKTSDGNVFTAKVKGNNFEFEYGSSLPYAAIHEYGGIAGNGARIPKRPYLRPAVKEWKKNRLPTFKSELKLQIIREMKTWLANQKQLRK